MACRARGFHAGTALEEQKERAIKSFGVAQLTGEHGNTCAVKIGVIEGNGKLVLGDGKPMRLYGDSHRDSATSELVGRGRERQYRQWPSKSTGCQRPTIGS